MSLALLRHASAGLFHALAELGAVRMAPPRDPLAAAHRLAGTLGVLARAHDLRVELRGEVPRRAALIVANHVSYLDLLAILPSVPAIPLAKREVRDWPLVGPVAGAHGVVFVQRDSGPSRVRALRRVHDLLASGASVLCFPEGTTTRGDRVLPFWRGTFGIAQRCGVPVVPLAISYADRALAWCDGARLVPHYVYAAGCARLDATVELGAPITCRAGEPPEALAARARSAIIRMLERNHDARIRTDLPPARADAVLPAPVDDGHRRVGGRRDPRRAA